MADITKYTPINGGTLFSDLKSHFSLLRARKTVAFVYGFMFVFVVCTVLLAFSPSPNSSSPWFTNVFSGAGSTSSGSSSAPIFSDASYRSHFSSIFSYFLPNSTKNSPFVHPSSSGITSSNATFDPPKPKTEPPVVNNQTQTQTQNPSHRADVQASNSPETEKPSKNSTTSIAPATLTASNSNPNQTTIAATQNPPAPSNQPTIAVTQNHPAPSNQTTIVVTQNRPAPSNQTAIAVTQKGLAPTNQTTIAATQNRPAPTNQISNSPPPSTVGKNITGNGENRVAEKATTSSNLTPPLLKKQSNDSTSGTPDLLKSLSKCDFYDGKWVRDESYPLYKPGSCPLIDEQFNCFLNGRPDHNYYKLKWKPNGCSLPRLNGSHMLELLRGKRLVFVGDSLNRNMWESLVCILRNSIKDQTKVYEEFGRHHFRTEASYSFIFEDYKCSVEFFVSPFLVQEWEMPENNGTTKETLRLDVIGRSADKYKKADVLVFNTGHWWTHEKTSRGKDYYQEGSHIYSELNVIEAFRKALTTWARWVDSNVNPSKTHVLFRGYSASHFSGGQWNSGGQCDNETEPIKNEAYLSSYPPKMAVLESVLKGMKNDVSYLNITRITDYRKDGHPSIYRKLIKNLSAEEKKSPVHYQDCSHWCLPGVPDAWNELLYAELLVKQYKKQQRKH